MIDKAFAPSAAFVSRKRKNHVVLFVVKNGKYKDWEKKQSASTLGLIEEAGFSTILIVRNKDGGADKIFVRTEDDVSLYDFAKISADIKKAFSEDFLKNSSFEISGLKAKNDIQNACIGWGWAGYNFDLLKTKQQVFPLLLWPKDAIKKHILSFVDSVNILRNLVNMPANLLGPDELEQAVKTLAKPNEASVKVIKDQQLLDKNFPLIYTVGQASPRRPRLIEMTWGNARHPKVTIVGKGVVFDTGGLDLKPSQYMRLMKKDMGGAAHAIALADMIMANNLPIRLHVLLAIAENAISAGAYRPGDILSSRAGLTVEIDNTDAEGRLVLGDALARATEDDPALIIDFATLTGAARVALGPELPPFFSNRAEPVSDITAMAQAQKDPLWHMPLWQPYFSFLSSPIADMKNSGGSFAGAITAALFLEKFVDNRPWMHLDVYGWNPSAVPGQPQGGEIYALRTLYYWLKGGGLR